MASFSVEPFPFATGFQETFPLSFWAAWRRRHWCLGIFAVTDYVAVARFNQVPRFRYETVYDSRSPDQLVYKTLFFTAVQKNPGTEDEQVEIVK